MSVHSRLRSVQKSLKGREVALLWLRTSQSRGGYLEYWERGEFHTWVSENEEAALLYYLVIEVNGGVISTVDKWRALTSWAGLLGISMIDANRESMPVRFETVQDFSDRWRKKLRTLHLTYSRWNKQSSSSPKGILTDTKSCSAMQESG